MRETSQPTGDNTQQTVPLDSAIMIGQLLVLASLLATTSAFASSPTDPCVASPPPTAPTAPHKKTAFIHVDIQKCFTNGPPKGIDDDYAYCNPPATGGTDNCTRLGSLGVAEGATIVPAVNDLRHSCLFEGVFRSQDYHPADHISFASRHFGETPFSFADGPLPFVGYPIELACTKNSTEEIKDVACCLVDAAQPACMIGANGTTVCTQDTDPENPACSACVGPDANCTKMMQGMWTDHCEQVYRIPRRNSRPPRRPPPPPAHALTTPEHSPPSLQGGDSGFATGLEVNDDDVILQKGKNPHADAYSIFMDNPRLHYTPLNDMLREEGFEVCAPPPRARAHTHTLTHSPPTHAHWALQF